MNSEAMKLALEALDIVKIHFTQNRHVNEAITALREALAEQPAQQEPVAWLVYENWRKHSLFFTKEGAEDFKNASQRNDDLSGNLARWKTEPLYTSPPAQRKPLTDKDCTRIYNEANGITTKNPPITTERIFKAMRAAYGIKENT